MPNNIQPGDIVEIDYGFRKKMAIYLGYVAEENRHYFRDDGPFPFAFTPEFLSSGRISIQILPTD